MKPMVLIVEDEAPLVTLLRYNLEKEGFAVCSAGDGEEALLQIAENKPDAVLLDWMLPLVSGLEVCRQIRRSPRAVSSSGRSPGPVCSPTTSSGKEVGPVVGRICATATQPESSAPSGARIGTHRIRSANDRSARSCQSDTRECSHSRSAADRFV